jgi:hypothetical protein
MTSTIGASARGRGFVAAEGGHRSRRTTVRGTLNA